ncbi:hypothetical protein ABFA07_020143 [Porites harrisoni]
MPLLAVIRQASSMVWAKHRHGKSSKMHLTSWNTLEKKAKSVLTFLPSLCMQTLQSGNTRDGNQFVFRKSKKDLGALPPTQDALILHINRANYHTMVQNKALEPCPSLLKPVDSGWYYSEGLLKPKLMTREEVSAACLQLAYCGCSREGGCCVNRRCTCVQLSLSCSKACKCGNRCRNDRNTTAEENEA